LILPVYQMSSKETRIAAIFLKMAGMARDLNLLFFDSLFDLFMQTYPVNLICCTSFSALLHHGNRRQFRKCYCYPLPVLVWRPLRNIDRVLCGCGLRRCRIPSIAGRHHFFRVKMASGKRKKVAIGRGWISKKQPGKVKRTAVRRSETGSASRSARCPKTVSKTG